MIQVNVMSIVGYGRVSSTGQSLDVQIDKLTNYGCDKLFTEKKSGTTVEQRTEFKNCLNYLRESDTLVVTRLDRLCRSINDLTRISEELKTNGISLVVIEQNIDTSTSTGRLLFNMLGCIGEFENEIRKERQMDGIRKSLENGVKFGRKSKLTDEQVEQLKLDKQEGVSIKTLQSTYGISRDSVYRLVRE
jgi:DNA invertase Pin-like site-specific DNA recombinase